VVVVVVAALVVGGVLVVRSRQEERSVEGLCAELSAAQDLDRSLLTLDPATLKPQVAALRRAARVAPSDVEPAVSTLARFVAEVADDAEDTTGDPNEALADALAARQDRVDAVTAAGTEVQAWAAANCGLHLGGEDDATARTTTTAPSSDTTP